MNVAEEAMIFSTLGRHLAPVGLIGAAVAALLCKADDSLRDDLITSGPVAIVIGGDAGRILDARHSQYALDVHPDRISLHRLPPGASTNAIDGLDPSITVAPLIELAPPLVCVAGKAAADLFLRIRILCAAMAVGVAQGACDMAVAYARQREQFGRPIGSFQAVKHLCADMAVRCEAASTQTGYAALSAAADTPGAPFEVAAAKLLADRAAEANAAGNIQVHGGMGMAAECDAHFFLKRAAVLRMIAAPHSGELLDTEA